MLRQIEELQLVFVGQWYFDLHSSDSGTSTCIRRIEALRLVLDSCLPCVKGGVILPKMTEGLCPPLSFGQGNFIAYCLIRHIARVGGGALDAPLRFDKSKRRGGVIALQNLQSYDVGIIPKK